MIPSPIGLLVGGLLLLFGRLLGSTYIAALIMSGPFAATAFVTLTSLGGSSPLIYVLILLLLLASVVLKQSFVRDVSRVFREDSAAWLSLVLIFYAVVGALIFPRLFAGSFSVMQVNRAAAIVADMPLEPSSLNFTQAMYFTLSILTYFAVRLSLIRDFDHAGIVRGMAAGGWLAAVLGMIDLGGRLAGLGDVLEPVRTASYEMMTGEGSMVSGMHRIAGACSEASAYSSTTMPFLAFACAHWRATGSRASMWLTLVLFVLLMLSTSTTAMVCCALLIACLGASVLFQAGASNLNRSDIQLLAIAWMVITVALILFYADSPVINTFIKLVDEGVINKSSTESAAVRGMLNASSMGGFWATGGLGIGPGSSRTSSWAVAVVSQLGVIGTLMIVGLGIIIARGLYGRDVSNLNRKDIVIVRCSKAMALGCILPGVISGGGIDPGIPVFVALALICAVRAKTRPLGHASPFRGPRRRPDSLAAAQLS